MKPVLIGCSHGTSDPEGRAVIASILDAVREARPDLDIREAFVDVQEPEVAAVVAQVVMPDGGGARDAVVVPLLLSGGFHVSVDVAQSVADRGAGAGRAAAAAPLGPDSRLTEIAADRLREAGVRPDDAVVVAAAGSSRPEAARDVEHVVAALRELHPGPVSVGYGAMAQPTVSDAVASAREKASRVVVLAFLLAPGYFYNRVTEAGGDVVTRPLAPDPRLTEIVLDRYAEASEAL
ncbi:sirohydrochlorin chelatase [Pseudactinotalea sp.]|uniref:sirohydrochlorin chelatase n=1 Tax=Pseudactinotalea sp. TaxID=1926260 RepID=UPI003B3A8DF7